MKQPSASDASPSIVTVMMAPGEKSLSPELSPARRSGPGGHIAGSSYLGDQTTSLENIPVAQECKGGGGIGVMTHRAVLKDEGSDVFAKVYLLLNSRCRSCCQESAYTDKAQAAGDSL